MDAFDYALPPSAIAQQPALHRSDARLLVSLDSGSAFAHRRVDVLDDLLGPGDLLVVNDTRVLPARLRLHKASGGLVEVLLLEPARPQAAHARPADGDGGGGTEMWEALVRPGRRVPPGTELHASAVGSPRTLGEVVATVGERLSGAEGRRIVTFRDFSVAQRLGEVPLPPYIHEPLGDPGRYQTVYGVHPGSVAAPTAGLHLTGELLERCRARGVTVAAVDLAVGLDTFRPVAARTPEEHVMHSERYRVPPATMEACASARRVVAVGTTTVRALESAAATGDLEGRTSLFIYGSFPFAVVDVLLTNFHLPKSSLLLLVDAFYGPRWRALYEEALAEGYQFLSFGDAMLLGRGAGR